MSQTSGQFKINQRLKGRLFVFIGLTISILLLYTSKLVEIQLIKGSEYNEKSQRVIRKVVALPAPRGEFYDRNYISPEKNTKIVSNKGTKTLIAIPSHFKKGELSKMVTRLEKTLNRKPGEILSRIDPQKVRSNDEIILIDNLEESEATLFADYFLAFPKFIIRQTISRYYNYGPLFSHITGYIGSPTRKEIHSGIKSYQKIGKSGLEKYYDQMLRGEDGEIVQLKTARGEIEEQQVFKKIKAGYDLILTIDKKMQEVLSKNFEDKVGGAIILHPASGEVLALVSKPDFDPNILISLNKSVRREHLKKVRKQKAELNRVISAKYPPASTFKPLVALTALDERRVDASQKYFCPGKFILKSSYKHLADTTFHDWHKHGDLDMVNAMAQSCNVYFFNLGYKIGAEPIINYARHFRLDKVSSIDLPGEISGFIPSSLWKQKHYNQRWFDGDTVNMSVGQGFVQTTVLGMANFYSALVNDGVVYKPHIVKKIASLSAGENGKTLENVRKKIFFSNPISKRSLNVVRQGLRAVATRGTARGLFNRKDIIPVAGKSGTVQTRSNFRKDSANQHAWFIAYGPFDGAIKDIIVVAVFVEKGRGGSVGAGPIALEIFKHYTKRIRKKTIHLY